MKNTTKTLLRQSSIKFMKYGRLINTIEPKKEEAKFSYFKNITRDELSFVQLLLVNIDTINSKELIKGSVILRKMEIDIELRKTQPDSLKILRIQSNIKMISKKNVISKKDFFNICENAIIKFAWEV